MGSGAKGGEGGVKRGSADLEEGCGGHFDLGFGCQEDVSVDRGLGSSFCVWDDEMEVDYISTVEGAGTLLRQQQLGHQDVKFCGMYVSSILCWLRCRSRLDPRQEPTALFLSQSCFPFNARV